jgi:hypothetical protein
VLRSAGLFSPGPAASGLWVSGNYKFIARNWLPDATADDAKAGQPKSPRWATANRPKTNFGASARQVARLLASVALDKVLDAAACKEMRTMLSGAALPMGAYVDIGVKAPGVCLPLASFRR